MDYSESTPSLAQQMRDTNRIARAVIEPPITTQMLISPAVQRAAARAVSGPQISTLPLISPAVQRAVLGPQISTQMLVSSVARQFIDNANRNVQRNIAAARFAQLVTPSIGNITRMVSLVNSDLATSVLRPQVSAFLRFQQLSACARTALLHAHRAAPRTPSVPREPGDLLDEPDDPADDAHGETSDSSRWAPQWLADMPPARRRSLARTTAAVLILGAALGTAYAVPATREHIAISATFAGLLWTVIMNFINGSG